MKFVSRMLLAAQFKLQKIMLSGAALVDKSDLDQGDATGLIANVISKVLWIPAGLGAFYLVQGIVKYVQSYRDGNNPESGAQAGREILVGVGLIAIKFIVGPIIVSVLGHSV